MNYSYSYFSRDLSGFVETRRQLLTLRPAQRTNWIAFAVAHHLVCNYEMCLHVLEAYEKTSANDDKSSSSASGDGGREGKGSDSAAPSNEEAFETSEMVLYKGRVLEEGKQFEQAIDLLEGKSKKILDKLGAKEALGRMFLESGQLEKADALYRELIDRNPENTRYHDGLFKAMGLPPLGSKKKKQASSSALPLEKRKRMIEEYDRLKERHPKCIAFRRRIIELHSCEDDPKGLGFVHAVDLYVRPFLKKGIPSLFQSLRDLYEKKQNVKLIEDLFETYETSLRSDMKLPPVVQNVAGGGGTAVEEEVKQAPDVLVWVLAYLAQHYDHIGQIQKALDKVDRAISHTPTVIELYTIKSKIMKHAGHLESAALLSDHARQLDLADRYLNCHTVKYMLRSGDIQKANELAVLFTKDNTPANSKDATAADPLNSLKNLHEMQCIWYEYELGKVYSKLAESEGFENTGRALHKFNYILKHFDDMHEDQFDFHSYCLRKMTLRSYIDMLKFEDKIFAHPFYSKGACGAIRCYLQLYDDPPAERKKKEKEEEELMLSKMTPNERKKYKSKQRKLQKQKEQQEQGGKTGDGKEAGSKNDTRPFLVKEEEECQKLLYSEKPLEEVHKLLQKLQEYQKEDPQMDTQLLAFEWSMRSNKLLMALQSVRSALKIDPCHPDAHKAFVRLVLETQKDDPTREALHPVVNKVMTEYVSKMLGSGTTLQAYVEKYLDAHGSTSMVHCLAAIEAICLVEGGKSLVDLLKKHLVSGSWFQAEYLQDRLTTHASCESVHRCLKKLDGIGALDQEWKQLCAKHFNYSVYFEGSQAKQLKEDPESILVLKKALDTLAIN